MKGKSADFFKTSVAALEEVELLCTVVLDTGTGTIISPQAPVPHIVLALEVNQTVSSTAYWITLNGFMLLNSWGLNKCLKKGPVGHP